MRILISTGLFPNCAKPHRGIYILRQAVALSRRADVRVISPLPYFPGILRWNRYRHFAEVPARDIIEGIDVVYPRYLIAPKLFRAHHGLSLAVAILDPLSRVVREFRPDVMIAFFAFPDGFATVRAGKRLGVPVITGVLGSDVHVIGKSGVRRSMVRKCLRDSAKVLSVCSSLADEVARMGLPREKIVIIRNGVDPEGFVKVRGDEARARLGLPREGQVVLFVGNLVRVKGVDVLLRAFAELRTDAELVLVGDGDLRMMLENLARELGVNARVRFAGAKPPSEVPMWMAASDLVVLPSRAEGHPNVVMEALASGRPVVATRVGGVPEVICSEDLGQLVDAEDPLAFARAIESALARDWDEDAIRSVGLARTWDDVASEIMAEIEPLLEAPEESP